MKKHHLETNEEMKSSVNYLTILPFINLMMTFLYFLTLNSKDVSCQSSMTINIIGFSLPYFQENGSMTAVAMISFIAIVISRKTIYLRHGLCRISPRNWRATVPYNIGGTLRTLKKSKVITWQPRQIRSGDTSETMENKTKASHLCWVKKHEQDVRPQHYRSLWL